MQRFIATEAKSVWKPLSITMRLSDQLLKGQSTPNIHFSFFHLLETLLVRSLMERVIEGAGAHKVGLHPPPMVDRNRARKYGALLKYQKHIKYPGRNQATKIHL